MRSFCLVAVALAVAPSLLGAQIMGRDQEVFTQSEPVAKGEWFRFFGVTGDITVTEGTGNQVEVRAEKVLRRVA